MENYFNYHKILKSEYLYCEEKDSRQTFILSENLGHFSTEGVTAPYKSTQCVHHVINDLPHHLLNPNTKILCTKHQKLFFVIYAIGRVPFVEWYAFKGSPTSIPLTCIKKIPVHINKAILSRRPILLAVLLYEQFVHLTRISLCPNTQFLSTQQCALYQSVLVIFWFYSVCVTSTRWVNFIVIRVQCMKFSHTIFAIFSQFYFLIQKQKL